ncbi:MAG TPA: class I SAM-dependent methyltransferase [Bryobacteraceae bacterium]|jgi:SAM-dependent methyltransferase|nr:class I SAM-dependent methyltransferase [Bryobacteraceae bacterium]
MPQTTQAFAVGSRGQDEVNRAVYFSPAVPWYYRRMSMMPAETACLSKYESDWLGRDVLDIGAGTGRTTRFLAPRARRYAAIDYSPVMVRYLKKRMPEIDVRQMDFRDLGAFADGAFDFVLATANVIDALPHPDRMRALAESRRVLRAGGVLAFSAHNLNYKLAFSGPRMRWCWNPVRLASKTVQYAIGSWNHRRIGPLRARTPEYALLNDPGHFYASLHYYAARATVHEQLERSGMRLVDVFDATGRVLAEADDDSENPWLFYVARARPQ